MNTAMTTLWLCPLCREPLQRLATTLQCPQRHCFDCAREGYVNLLPVNRKRSLEPGDSRAMVEARRRVHQADLYRPLAEALLATLRPLLSADATLLDLGCGEGYYSQSVLAALPRLSLYGIDIAKPAVRMAAKACPTGQFAVASAFDIPLPAQSMAAVFSVFAPVSAAQLQRLLPTGGYFIRVTPGPRHLWALRQLLYDSPRPHAVDAAVPPGFADAGQLPVQFTLKLAQDLLQDVVAMTPYAHSGQRENKQALAAVDSLAVQADFVISLYCRSDVERPSVVAHDEVIV